MKSFKIKVNFVKNQNGIFKNAFKIKQKTTFFSEKGFTLKVFEITKQVFI